MVLVADTDSKSPQSRGLDKVPFAGADARGRLISSSGHSTMRPVRLCSSTWCRSSRTSSGVGPVAAMRTGAGGRSASRAAHRCAVRCPAPSARRARLHRKVTRPTALAPPPSAAPPPPPARRRSAPAPRRQPVPLSARIARRAVRSVSLNDQPERTKLSQPVLEPTDRDRGSKHGETAALDERQLEPARDHRAGEVTMADEHHVA